MEFNLSKSSFVQKYLIAYLVIVRFYKIHNPLYVQFVKYLQN